MPIPFPDSTGGPTSIEGDVETIAVNDTHTRTRRRFSIAHELGRFLSGHEDYDHGRTYVESRPSRKRPSVLKYGIGWALGGER